MIESSVPPHPDRKGDPTSPRKRGEVKRNRSLNRHCEERSNPVLHAWPWIALRSLSSGGHSPDPLDSNDGVRFSLAPRLRGEGWGEGQACPRIPKMR